jgi:hypothetical protein
MADPDVGVTLDQLRGKEGAMVLEQVLLVYTHTHTIHIYTHKMVLEQVLLVHTHTLYTYIHTHGTHTHTHYTCIYTRWSWCKCCWYIYTTH